MTVSLGGVCTFHSRFETLKSVFKCVSRTHPLLKRYNARPFVLKRRSENSVSYCKKEINWISSKASDPIRTVKSALCSTS